MKVLKIKFYGSLVVLVLLALYALASEMSYHDALVERQQYCDMVRLHQHNPAVGWPDYRGIYRSECVQKKVQP